MIIRNKLHRNKTVKYSSSETFAFCTYGLIVFAETQISNRTEILYKLKNSLKSEILSDHNSPIYSVGPENATLQTSSSYQHLSLTDDCINSRLNETIKVLSLTTIIYKISWLQLTKVLHFC